MFLFLFLLFTGVIAGILSGLLGIGGGVVVVPALVYLFQYAPYDWVPKSLVMPMAIATSLMAISFTALMSAYTHYRKGSVRWDIVLRWMIGLYVGAIVGSFLAATLTMVWLRTVFSVFLLLVVLKLFLGEKLPKIPVPSSTFFLLMIGGLIGVLSALLGVGGGLLMMPILIGLKCTMPEAAGTSSASIVPVSLIAGINFMFTGEMQHIAVAWSTGYVYWPAVIVISCLGIIFAPLGVKLSYKLPALWTKRFLAFLLLAIAITLLV